MMLPPIRGLPWPLWSRGEPGLVSPCFFFSSRRRHTRSLCDWSSDVCSSDLALSLAKVAQAARPGWENPRPPGMEAGLEEIAYWQPPTVTWSYAVHAAIVEVDRDTGRVTVRSEERRVGKECRCRMSP